MKYLILLIVLLLVGCRTEPSFHTGTNVTGIRLTMTDQQVDECAKDLADNMRARIKLREKQRE